VRVASQSVTGTGGLSNERAALRPLIVGQSGWPSHRLEPEAAHLTCISGNHACFAGVTRGAHPVAADAAAVVVLIVQQRRRRRRAFRRRQAQAERQGRWLRRRRPGCSISRSQRSHEAYCRASLLCAGTVRTGVLMVNALSPHMLCATRKAPQNQRRKERTSRRPPFPPRR